MFIRIATILKRGQELMFFGILAAVAVCTCYYFKATNPEYIAYKEASTKLDQQHIEDVTKRIDYLVWALRNKPELACKVALKLEKAKQIPAAIALIHGTIANNSQNLLVVKTYATILWKDQKAEMGLSVISLYEEGGGKTDYATQATKSAMLISTGKYLEAISTLQKLQTTDEEGNQHNLKTDKVTGPLLAEAMMRSGNIASGMLIYKELIAANPTDKMLRITYARTLITSAQADAERTMNKSRISKL